MNLCIVIPKVLIFSIAIALCCQSVLMIVLTGVWGTDRDSASMYPGSICTDSVFNEYRPFRASFETKSGNITSYKICSHFYQGNRTQCYKGDTHVDPRKYVYCGWSSMRIFQHVASHLLLISFTIFGIIWTFKDVGIWVIVGIVYTIMVAIGFIFSCWVFLMDAVDVTASRSFCDYRFQSEFCSPLRLVPEVVQTCTCEYFGYIFTGPILHFIGCILYAFLFVVICVRWYAYRYQNIAGDVVDYEKQRTPLFTEKEKEERVKDIYQKYGF